MVSHLGQNPWEHVMLEIVMGMTGGYGPLAIEFVRTTADGVKAPGPPPGGLRVPSRKLLVITDVDWQYANGNAGQMQVLRLFLDPLAGPTAGLGERVFESAVVLGPKGEAGRSEAMTAGFTVSSKARIGVDVVPGPTGPGKLQHLLLRGYLTAAAHKQPHPVGSKRRR
jgi:hypothetical protein